MKSDTNSLDISATLEQAGDALDRAVELSATAAEAPAVVPGYRILQLIGSGKYGSVWLARELNTGKRVAIKFYTQRRGVDWSLLSREVEKLAVLYTSRNIVGLLAVGWDHDPPYYVMEYLENGSLAQRLEQGPLPTSDAVRIATQIAQGLVHAHGSGILHCDLKPANVLLDKDFSPRLCDFGQSRLADERSHALGTLFYMAPDQADLKGVADARWDVYALGAILYHMLLGTPPYRTPENEQRIAAAGDLEQRLTCYRELVQRGPKLTQHREVPGVDSTLAEIIDRCLAADPNRRFANAQAVLDRLHSRERQRARRPLVVLGLVLPILLLLATAPLAMRAMQDAVLTARNNVTNRALESDALSVKLLAGSLQRELDDRLRELERVADDEEVRVAVAEHATKPRSERESLSDVLLAEKHRVERRRTELGRSLDATWFLCDAQGVQRWRDPPSDVSLDKNYAYRDYFHGLNRNYSEHNRPAELIPLRRPHISRLFRSETTDEYMVALSVPIWDYTEERIVGVLARTVTLSQLLSDYDVILKAPNDSTHSRVVSLVDRRDWQLLAHRWLTADRLHELRDDDYHKLRLDEATASRVDRFLTAIGGAGEESTAVKEDEEPLDRTEEYHDPVGLLEPRFDGPWLAAFCQVKQTDWVAIVQERRESTWQPVEELQRRMWWFGLDAVVIFFLLVGASWWLIVRGVTERGWRWWRKRERSPNLSTASLSMTARGGESA